MSEEKIKYLEFIQNIVTRMNQNSFMIKGWTVAIVSALLAVYADKENKLFILISIFPVSIFMFLDSYYLWQERKFRHLYSKALDEDEFQKVKLFSMNTNIGNECCKICYFKTLFSVTEIGFYSLLIVCLLALYFAKI
ncbi:hypothetical protein [uncultured Treponema sp.]|uniref:hypothetical protein n=1 Tax=uncultured Treponema sp. TaxID=162155 RepID=UPI0025FDB663|nr:hypothetical protein [uncultured Treponema sp.]